MRQNSFPLQLRAIFFIKFYVLMFLLFNLVQLRGQTTDTISPDAKKLKFYLNDDKTHWLAFHTYAQLWTRLNENNPGSMVSDELQDQTFDISVRRFRMGLQAQLTDKLWVYSQLGINNLNYLSPRGTSLDLLDAYAEYSFSKSFSLGAGKTAWTGLSRYSAPNTSKLLSYDLLLLALPTDDETNDLIRKLSVYVKGKLGKLDYRFVTSKPFLPSNSPNFDGELVENVAKFNDKISGGIYSGYLKWQFWDAEPNDIPFSDGTYLGNRTIFNIGIGAEFQNDALSSLENGAEKSHDMRLWAVDAFFDKPIDTKKNTVLTAYLSYFNYNFGPSFIRNTGANNPINKVNETQVSFNGPGNAFPVVGTGNSFFGQIGYLFPRMGKTKNYGQVQPYISAQHSSFERLDDPMFYYDIGVNWLLKGHLSKFSLNFQNRPIYYSTTQGIFSDQRKWSAVLQYIIRLE